MGSKTLQELLRHGASLLHDRPTPALEAKVLLLRAGALTDEELFASPDRCLSCQAEAYFFRLIQRRISGVPLSYLTGTKEFWSIPLMVSPSVFIPRPETEILVEKVLELSNRDKEAILDVGTGSGNIAIALARELPRAQVTGADVSERALRLARRNAARHKVRNVDFVKSNLFSKFRKTGSRFDFIVSNPPYIPWPAWLVLPPEIRDFEPRRALLAGESGLELIARLVRQAGTFLKPGGHLVIEIGDGQRDAVVALFGRRWTEIETAWDLAGKPRVITARRA